MRDSAQQFLRQQGWGDALPESIAGDLSVRSYFRVQRASTTAVLMDAGALPASVPPFLKMTDWLRSLGLSAPEIYATDPQNGLVLIEDLGRTSVRELLAGAQSQDKLFTDCVELLLAIRKAVPPALSRPSARELCEWTKLADAFYPGAQKHLLDRVRAVLEPILLDMINQPATVSLRDFHADNLMWLPNRDGVARLGLLDYQDAILTHPVYDLVSLLTDARTQVSEQTRRRMIEVYVQASGDDTQDTDLAFNAFSLQRNLRILGIFHRASQQDGKTQHLAKVPRVYGYLKEALAHPAFSEIQPLFEQAMPPPEGLT